MDGKEDEMGTSAEYARVLAEHLGEKLARKKATGPSAQSPPVASEIDGDAASPQSGPDDPD